MKKVVFIILGILLVLALVILSGGCASKVTTPPPATTQNVTGTLTDINTPAEPGADVVTIQTPQGERALPITANTQASLEGKACTLDQIAALDLAQEAKASYNCTIVYGVDANGNQIVVGLDVTKVYP